MDMKTMTDKAIQAELAGRLQKERLNQNLSQSELAQRSGISLRTLKYIEGRLIVWIIWMPFYPNPGQVLSNWRV
jgi:ribosome-binding protein aMBF1 (putative translation factor)